MKLAILALCALPLFGQFTITASKLATEIARAPAGTIPKSLSIFTVLTCNTSAQAASLFPDAAVQEIAKTHAVQDGLAVIYAAAQHKQSNWKVLGLSLVEIAIPAATGFGMARAATTTTRILAGLGGGVALQQNIANRKQELARLDVPDNWWTPGKAAVPLEPGRCHSMLLTIAGEAPGVIPPLTLVVAIGTSGAAPSVTGSRSDLGKFAFGLATPSAPPIVTHPDPIAYAQAQHDHTIINGGGRETRYSFQVDDPTDPLADARFQLENHPSPETERVYFERLKAIGAQQ